MSNPVDSKPGGIQDGTGAPASSKITANTSVRTASGTIGIQTDVPQFSGATVTGVWTLGATRCRINGIPVINTASVGIGVASAPPPPTTGPLSLAQSDDKVKAL